MVGILIRRFLFSVIAAGIVWAGDPQASETSPSHSKAIAEPEAVLFDELPAVETAALYAQTLQEAPASVTVITEQEIKRYGYRTLAEALANVRGFYVTSDGALYYGGVRGFNLPGDYNTRILVLVNGHYLTDNVYGAMYLFGQDFGIDMDLIQRIEVVRGPSSALYGSNGIFATINIFTRAPADSPRASASTEFGSFGEKKARVSSSMYLGKGINLLLSAATFHAAGRTIEVPGLGRTDRIGAEQGYHTFAHLTWRDWSFIANFSDRKVLAPMGWYGADFGDSGTSSRDAHNYAEASWTRNIGKASSMRWRTYYDQYRYAGRYDYTSEGVTTDQRDLAFGDWAGTRLSLQTPVKNVGSLTFGGQADVDIRSIQRGYYAGDEINSAWSKSHPNRSYGLFAQQEWNVSSKWTLFFGARVDDSVVGQPFISPRVAAVHKSGERSAYKFLYGRAFRNPSTYERYYEPNPLLDAEKINTFEFVREQGFGKRLDAVLSVYHYRLAGLIEGVPTSDIGLQYQNMRDSQATGFEAELRARPAEWLETVAGFALQETKYSGASRLPNSPHVLDEFRASAPLFQERLRLSMAARHLSSRITPYGWSVGSATIADITATIAKLHPQYDLQLGIRNLFDRKYLDPMSEEHTVTALPRAGRSIFVKLSWRFGD